MKLEHILSQRTALLQQVHLANLSFSYAKLAEFGARVKRAGLRGLVTLRQAQPDAEHYVPSLTLVEGNQSVIEEHFADEEIADLADVVGYLANQPNLDLTFQLDEFGEKFVVPLRRELERIGVRIDDEPPLDPLSEGSSTEAGCTGNEE